MLGGRSGMRESRELKGGSRENARGEECDERA